MGAYLMHATDTNPARSYDCLDYVGFQCSQPRPVWRHRFRGTWETNFNMNFSLAWRYLGGAENDDASPDSDLTNPAQMELWTGSQMDKFPTFNWIDLAASYNFGGGVMLTMGVNNVLDKEPPLAPGFSDDPIRTLHGSYESLGGYIFSSIQFNFSARPILKSGGPSGGRLSCDNDFNLACSHDGAWLTYRDFERTRRCVMLRVEAVDDWAAALDLVARRTQRRADQVYLLAFIAFLYAFSRARRKSWAS